MTASAQIRCAICGTPVQRVEWFDDPRTNTRVIRAYCHGARDEMRLSMSTMASRETMRQIEHGDGLAFQPATPALPL